MVSFFKLLQCLLFPTFCCGCGKLGRLLCFNCYEELEYVTNEVGLKLPVRYIEQVQAAVQYQPPTDNLLHQLKYQSVHDVGKYCGQLIYQTVTLPPADVIAYIPLHPTKQRQRGFNQAQVIAETLADLLCLPCYPLLSRTKLTSTQAQLKSDQERLQNMVGAFSFNHRFSVTKLRVLIIDDVVTTGSTLNEAARILQLAGAAHVYGVAVAHGQ